MVIHVVSPGETPASIAAQYGVPLDRLLADNGLTLEQPLVVGQALVILFADQTYTVNPGDTLSSIAAQFGTDTNQLLRNNPRLMGDSALTAGDVLVINWLTEKQGLVTINGYAYPFIQPIVLQSTLPYLSALSVFSYGFESDGTLVVPDDAAMIAAAKERGVAPILVFTTLSSAGVFRSELAGQLFSDPALQQTVLDRLLQVMMEKGYDGIDVDFEFIPPESAAGFVGFVESLAARTREVGKFTMVALAPKTSVDQPGLLYEAHDYAALGAVADYVLLMTYEWGYAYGPPMAVAPLDSVRRVLEFGVTQIPPEKIFMGIPNYGYDWTLPYTRGGARARTISVTEAVDIARRYNAEILFDETAQSPFFYYSDEAGAAHVVWFEDARSIAQKLALIPALSLRGASYWTIMYPFQSNWSLLNALYDLRQ